MDKRATELTALLIAPNRELAKQFSATLPATRTFQILADLKSYPPEQTLDMRLRQLKPDIILLDLATDLNQAAEIIRFVTSSHSSVYVVGLHTANDSEAILKSLRMGASEFLYAPFEVNIQHEAIARIRRLRQPDSVAGPESGNIVVFSSAKAGSGSSTLAAQTAFALKRLTGQRVLLADFDLTGGTIAFYLKLNHPYSLLNALEHAAQLDSQMWPSLVVNSSGVDVLPAPATPYAEPVENTPLHIVLEYARSTYDWIVIDLPPIFHRLSLLTVSESDRAFLVSTSELPSLHLGRKAVNLLEQLGFPKERFKILINRLSKREGISGTELEKLFNCPVHASLPNDYFALHRVVTLGHALAADCELGRAFENLAGRLSASVAAGMRTQ